MTGAETVVCVLGAPRSGTSLTARMLNLCGLYLGEDGDLVPPSPENRAGYWELRRAVELNEQILVRLGGSSVAAPALPSGWETATELDDLRSFGEALIAEVFANRPAWGWKDPRNSFTLPFWRSLLERQPRNVICVRNPLDAAASARRMAGIRHEMDHRQAIDAWERYTASAIVNTSGRPRLFVAYEDYFTDCEAAAERLALFAGLDRPTGANMETSKRLVDRQLRHYGSSPTETLRNGALTASAQSLYGAIESLLCRRPTSEVAGNAADNELVDRMAASVLAAEPEKLVGPPTLKR